MLTDHVPKGISQTKSPKMWPESHICAITYLDVSRFQTRKIKKASETLQPDQYLEPKWLRCSLSSRLFLVDVLYFDTSKTTINQDRHVTTAISQSWNPEILKSWNRIWLPSFDSMIENLLPERVAARSSSEKLARHGYVLRASSQFHTPHQKTIVTFEDIQCMSYQLSHWQEQILHLIIAKRPRRYAQRTHLLDLFPVCKSRDVTCQLSDWQEHIMVHHCIQ